MNVSADALAGEAWRYSIEHLDGEWAFAHDFLYAKRGGVYLNDSSASVPRRAARSSRAIRPRHGAGDLLLGPRAVGRVGRRARGGALLLRSELHRA